MVPSSKHCWYPLVPGLGEALDPSWGFPEPPTKGNGVWRIPASTMLTPSLMGSFEDRGLPIGNVMLFYRPAWAVDSEAHIDIMPRNPERVMTAAINIVVGGKGSRMHWHDLPDDRSNIRWTMAGTPYLSWPTTELTEIDGCEIGQHPCLVRVDVPHSISVSGEPRWCISIRFVRNFASWEDAIVGLSNAGLLAPRWDR